MKIRVSIIEDDSSLRKAIKERVDGDKRFEVVSEYPSAEDAIEGIPVAKPNVVLSDINLPGLSGIECVRKLKPEMPTTQFLMLTVYEDTERIFQALSAGATGYLLKRAPRSELLTAIADVHKGESPMSSGIARKIVRSFQNVDETSTQDYKLAPRQKQVLELLAHGYLYKEIADRLGLSITTVNCYIRGIYEKLQVHSRSQAVAKFLKL